MKAHVRKKIAFITLTGVVLLATALCFGSASAVKADPSDTLSPQIRQKGKGPVAKNLPDLVVTGITMKDPQTLRVTVKNAGKAQAKNTTVQMVIGGSKQSKIEWVEPLAAGKSKVVEFKLAQPLAGKTTVTATVDPSNYIMEMKEDNNTYTTTLGKGPAQKDLPDLVVTRIVKVSAEFVEVTVKNIGQGPAMKQSRLELQLLKGAQVGYANLGTRVALVPTLKAGETYKMSIPLELAQGVIVDAMVAIVDTRNDVAESNESNNQLRVP